jgi:hypothetical protein
MKTLKAKLLASGLASVVIVVITSGAAEAKLAANHNETLLPDAP